MQRPGNKLFGFIKEKESHFSGTRALQYYPGFQVCWGYGCALSSPSVWDLPQLMTNLDTNISPVVTFFPLINHSSNVYWATASVWWLPREGQPSLVAFVLFFMCDRCLGCGQVSGAQLLLSPGRMKTWPEHLEQPCWPWLLYQSLTPVMDMLQQWNTGIYPHSFSYKLKWFLLVSKSLGG